MPMPTLAAVDNPPSAPELEGSCAGEVAPAPVVELDEVGLSAPEDVEAVVDGPRVDDVADEDAVVRCGDVVVELVVDVVGCGAGAGAGADEGGIGSGVGEGTAYRYVISPHYDRCILSYRLTVPVSWN
jgi:hypothetical protein